MRADIVILFIISIARTAFVFPQQVYASNINAHRKYKYAGQSHLDC